MNNTPTTNGKNVYSTYWYTVHTIVTYLMSHIINMNKHVNDNQKIDVYSTQKVCEG